LPHEEKKKKGGTGKGSSKKEGGIVSSVKHGKITWQKKEKAQKLKTIHYSGKGAQQKKSMTLLFEKKKGTIGKASKGNSRGGAKSRRKFNLHEKKQNTAKGDNYFCGGKRSCCWNIQQRKSGAYQS